MHRFQSELLGVCADDGESQTLLIISALIRMTGLENILEGLQLAHNGCGAMLIGCHKAAIHDQPRQGLSDRPFWPRTGPSLRFS